MNNLTNEEKLAFIDNVAKILYDECNMMIDDICTVEYALEKALNVSR